MSWQDFQAKFLEIANTSPYIAGVKKPGRTIQRMQYYCYDTQIISTASLATGNSTIETQADSDFVLTYISGGTRLLTSSDMDYSTNVLLQIVDQSTGKPFFNVPSLMPLVAGAAGFPFNLAAPRVINPNTTLGISALNRTAATLASIELALHGTRIFYE